MFARRLLTISLLFTAVSGYLYYFQHQRWCIWVLIVGVLLTMSTYIFQHQLNWWWYQRYPPGLPEEIQRMYTKASAFYRSLNPADKALFDLRARLFVESKEFIPQGFESVPEDVKYIVAFYAVLVTLKQKSYLFNDSQRVVIYPHPFLSPNFPDQIHTYELENEDGTIIFSLEQLAAGFLNPSKFYQTGLHAFGELYALEFLKSVTPGEPDAIWAELSRLSDWSHQRVEEITGLAQPSPVPVMIYHWFSYHDRMQKDAPKMYQTVSHWMLPQAAISGNE